MTLPCHDNTPVSLARKARSIELQAGHAAPPLAAQLRALAAKYRIEADSLARATADAGRG